MGSLLAPAKSGIIFIGILIGQVGRGPFLVPVMLLASPPATSLLNPTISLHQFPRSCYFPGTRFEGHTKPACVSLGKVGAHTISQVLAGGGVTLGKWRQPPSYSGQSIVRREANSRIPRNPRIQELRFGSRGCEHLRVSIRRVSHRHEGWWVSV